MVQSCALRVCCVCAVASCGYGVALFVRSLCFPSSFSSNCRDFSERKWRRWWNTLVCCNDTHKHKQKLCKDDDRTCCSTKEFVRRHQSTGWGWRSFDARRRELGRACVPWHCDSASWCRPSEAGGSPLPGSRFIFLSCLPFFSQLSDIHCLSLIPTELK
jgi:hypothetical protein